MDEVVVSEHRYPWFSPPKPSLSATALSPGARRITCPAVSRVADVTTNTSRKYVQGWNRLFGRCTTENGIKFRIARLTQPNPRIRKPGVSEQKGGSANQSRRFPCQALPTVIVHPISAGFETRPGPVTRLPSRACHTITRQDW